MWDKKRCSLIQLLDAGRIIIGVNRGFGSQKESYEVLQNELKNDWEQKVVGEKGRRFEVGEHLLVNSTECNGLQRAVIMDLTVDTERTPGQPPSYAYYYTVFLYDEGKLKILHEQHVMALTDARKEELEPRTVIVRLSVVPANPQRVMTRKKHTQAYDGLDSSKFSYDSEWPESSSRKVLDWLRDPNVKYLAVETSQTNLDGSLYGDIYRRIRPQTQDHSADDGREKLPKEYLTDFILSQRLGLVDTDNALKVGTSKTEKQRSKAIYTGVNDEEVLVKTRQTLTLGRPILDNRKAPRGAQRKTVWFDGCFTSGETTSTNASSSRSGSIVPSSLIANACSYDGNVPADENNSESSGSIGISYLFGDKEHVKPTSVTHEKVNIPGRLLVRASSMKNPYTKMEEYQLHERIVKALSAMGICELSDMHNIAAPNFIRGMDLILISPDAGKPEGKKIRALSYLLPILRIVYDKYDQMSGYDDLDPPEAIIIVNSYSTGVSLESYLKQMLNFSQHLPMRVKFLSRGDNASGKSSSVYSKNMVPGGISVLIITMPFLAAIMETKGGPFLLGRLRFLIFEEADLYLKEFNEQILTFLNAARENLEVSFSSPPFQITFSGSKWTSDMETLYKKLVHDRAPMVIIAGANQVLRYAKIKWKVHYVKDEDNRLQSLGGILEKNCLGEHQRIVITCSTPAVASLVYNKTLRAIGPTGVQIQMIVSGMDMTSFEHALNLWSKNTVTVLVISDDMMENVKISNADCLICFDSPLLQVEGGVKRSVAAERFRYVWANIRHIEIEHDPSATLEDIPKTKNLIAHFLMTGEEHNFLHMYKFGSSFGDVVVFPEELKLLAKLMEQSDREDVPMCTGTKLFGFCTNADRESCPLRHFFSKAELSATPSAPFSGELEVRIIKCENPSLYKAEMIRHFIYENGNRIQNISYVNEMERRKIELEDYYAAYDEEENRERNQLREFKEGSWCAVKVKDPDSEYYSRAKIEKILQRDNHGVPSIVRVYCVDTGLTMNPSGEKLYRIPREFQKWPPLVVDLILCNVQPTRDEKEYRQLDCKKARTIALEKVFNARIWLSVGNTIWVNPVLEHCVDPITKKASRGFSLRFKLIEKQIVESNGTHLAVLIESAKKYPGIYKGVTDIYEKSPNSLDAVMSTIKKVYHQLGDKIEWAFVEKSTGDEVKPVKIVTQCGYGPWLFFAVHDSYYDIRSKLEAELHQCIKEKIAGKKEKEEELINYAEAFNEEYYQVGMVVAAKERVDQTWARALIIKKHEKRQGEPEKMVKFDVFFVDVGDCCDNMSVEELFPIPRKFVTQLPFQAIAFKLDHVQPLGNREKWTKEEEDEFLDIIVKDSTSIDVDIVAHGDAERCGVTVSLPCRYYNAVVFHEGTELGSSLVEKGSAEWRPGKEDFVRGVEGRLLELQNVVSASQVQERRMENDEPWGQRAEVYLHGADFHEWFGIQQNGFRIPSSSLSYDVQTGFFHHDPAEIQEQELIPTIPPSTSAVSVNHSDTSSAPTPVVKAVAASSATPCPHDEFLRPQVRWSESNATFVLTIHLPDVQMYELQILDDKRSVHFETLDKPKNYGFTIRLYGKVESKFSTLLTGQYLRIRLTKLMKKLWIRPLYSKDEKYTWFKGDLDFLQDEDDSDESIFTKNDLKESTYWMQDESKTKVELESDLDVTDVSTDDEK